LLELKFRLWLAPGDFPAGPELAARLLVFPVVSVRSYLELASDPRSGFYPEAQYLGRDRMRALRAVSAAQEKLTPTGGLTVENAREIVEDALLHEIGEAMALVLRERANRGDVHAKALWDWWARELAPSGLSSGLGLFGSSAEFVG
jgi:hypothetical protein